MLYFIMYIVKCSLPLGKRSRRNAQSMRILILEKRFLPEHPRKVTLNE